jgi:hypothetical protein
VAVKIKSVLMVTYASLDSICRRIIGLIGQDFSSPTDQLRHFR